MYVGCVSENCMKTIVVISNAPIAKWVAFLCFVFRLANYREFLFPLATGQITKSFSSVASFF
jgi:hypothetical protein